MKKSDKKFTVTIPQDGGFESTTDVGTRSGVANFVRELLGTAEVGKTITLKINVTASEPAAPLAPAE